MSFTVPSLFQPAWGPVNNAALANLNNRVTNLEAAGLPAWLVGSGAPTSSTGRTGDFYVNSANGFVYKKTDAVTWTYEYTAMGQTGPQGPQGLPGVNAVPADSAVGTYVGTDGTSTAGAVLTRIVDALPNFRPEDYGATPDGGDCSAALRAALTAANAANGGAVVRLKRGKRYGFKGVVTVPNGTFLEGTVTQQNLAPGASPTLPGLVALDSAAQLQVGEWSANSQPGGVRNVYVDGNFLGGSTSAKKGLVRIAGVDAKIEGLFVHRSAGDGIVYDGVQNTTVIGGMSTFHVGAALVMDNGAGGVSFHGGYYGTSKGGVCVARDTAGETNLYPFGPTQNTWFGTVFEAYAGQSAPIAEPNAKHVYFSGRSNVFVGCNFTGGAQNSAAATVLIDDALSGIPSTISFVSCLWWVHGGHDAVRIQGNPTVTFVGQQEVGDDGTNHALSFVCIDGGFPHVAIEGEVVMAQNLNGSNIFRTINGGSLLQCFSQRDVGTVHRLRVGQTVGWRRDGDTTPRGTIDRDFGHGWYTDAGVPTASLTRGTGGTGLDLSLGGPLTVHGDEIASQTGLNTTGRRTIGSSDWIFAGNATYTLDASVQSVYKVTWSGAATTTFAFSGAAEGRMITVVMYPAVVPASITWPASVVWGAAGAPTLTAGKPTTVVFRYDATFSQWLQTAAA